MSGAGPNPLRQTAGARAPSLVRSLGQVEGRAPVSRVEALSGYGGVDPDDRSQRGPWRVRLSPTARALLAAGVHGYVETPGEEEKRQRRYLFEGRNHTLVYEEALIEFEEQEWDEEEWIDADIDVDEDVAEASEAEAWDDEQEVDDDIDAHSEADPGPVDEEEDWDAAWEREVAPRQGR